MENRGKGKERSLELMNANTPLADRSPFSLFFPFSLQLLLLLQAAELLLMFAWKMTRPVNLVALYSGLPLVGLGSFAVQTSINGSHRSKGSHETHATDPEQLVIAIARAAFPSFIPSPLSLLSYPLLIQSASRTAHRLRPRRPCRAVRILRRGNCCESLRGPGRCRPLRRRRRPGP